MLGVQISLAGPPDKLLKQENKDYLVGGHSGGETPGPVRSRNDQKVAGKLSPPAIWAVLPCESRREPQDAANHFWQRLIAKDNNFYWCPGGVARSNMSACRAVAAGSNPAQGASFSHESLKRRNVDLK